MNINQNVNLEVMELNDASKEAQHQHAILLRQAEMQKRARTISVPTSINEVKLKLREYGQATTLFGEGHAERRIRLQNILSNVQINEERYNRLQELLIAEHEGGLLDTKRTINKEVDKAANIAKEIFYTPGSVDLINARKEICIFSFQQSKNRIDKITNIRENDALQAQENQIIGNLYSRTSEYTLISSHFADDRPLTCCRIANNGNNNNMNMNNNSNNNSSSIVASSSLSSNIKLWDSENLNCLALLRGHEERVISLSWHSDSQIVNNTSATSSLLASASADKRCNIWDCRINEENMSSNEKESANITPLRSLIGHKGVVSGCEFHPSGKYIGTSSHDYTWRLWDVETGDNLLLQDGHINECSSIAFHKDGSLAMTGDNAGVALLWDIRSGQQIHSFQGHVDKITSIDFNSNGFQVVTGSVDNVVRIWDLRKKKMGYLLPAHGNAISDVKYSKCGEILLTSSFDGTLKIWGTRDYALLRTLSGHSGKVMACDISMNDNKVISVGFDRTVKIWNYDN